MISLELVEHVIMKYANSHIYDLHAYFSGAVAFLIVLLLKRPIKSFNKQQAEGKAAQCKKGYYDGVEELLSYRRRNLILVVFAFVIGAGIFGIFSVVISRISLRFWTTLIAGISAVGMYAMYECIVAGWGERLYMLAILAITFFYNIFLCKLLMFSHYKTCYGIKVAICIFTAYGIGKQLFQIEASKEELQILNIDIDVTKRNRIRYKIGFSIAVIIGLLCVLAGLFFSNTMLKSKIETMVIESVVDDGSEYGITTESIQTFRDMLPEEEKQEIDQIFDKYVKAKVLFKSAEILHEGDKTQLKDYIYQQVEEADLQKLKELYSKYYK